MAFTCKIPLDAGFHSESNGVYGVKTILTVARSGALKTRSEQAKESERLAIFCFQQCVAKQRGRESH